MKTYLNRHLERLSATLAVCLVSISIWGCAPATQITGSWKSPEASQQAYDRIVVAALTDNVLARQEVESDLQAQLQQRGIIAVRSIDIFPPTGATKSGPDVGLLLEKIRSDKYDAILTAALIDEETDTRYVPGNYGYSPVTRFGWYGGFRGYYTYWQPILYEPGYYTRDKIYFLESNLYDAATENLLWSAQSRSYSPPSLRRAAEEFAEVTVEQMVKDRLISSQQAQP